MSKLAGATGFPPPLSRVSPLCRPGCLPAPYPARPQLEEMAQSTRCRLQRLLSASSASQWLRKSLVEFCVRSCYCYSELHIRRCPFPGLLRIGPRHSRRCPPWGLLRLTRDFALLPRVPSSSIHDRARTLDSASAVVGVISSLLSMPLPLPLPLALSSKPQP